MMASRLTFIVITLLLIAACDGASDAVLPRGNVEILEISSVPFTINDKDAVFINFAREATGECSLTLALERIKATARTKVLNEAPADIDLNCLKSEKLFLLSNLAPTSLEVHVDDVSRTQLMMTVSAQLYSIRAKESLTLSAIKVFVSGKRRALIRTQG